MDLSWTDYAIANTHNQGPKLWDIQIVVSLKKKLTIGLVVSDSVN